jgi:hypothetical protein
MTHAVTDDTTSLVHTVACTSQESVKAKNKHIFSLKQDASRKRVLRNRVLSSHKRSAKAAGAVKSFEKLAAVLCA